MLKDKIDNILFKYSNTKKILQNLLEIFAFPIFVSVIYWLTAVIQMHGRQIIDLLNSPLILPLGFSLGLFFYWLRNYHSFVYGLIEIAVAMLVILLSATSSSDNLLSKGLGVLGSVYISVRGLDNMSKRLPQSWQGLWGKLFKNRS